MAYISINKKIKEKLYNQYLNGDITEEEYERKISLLKSSITYKEMKIVDKKEEPEVEEESEDENIPPILKKMRKVIKEIDNMYRDYLIEQAENESNKKNRYEEININITETKELIKIYAGELVLVKAGTYQMGSPLNETGRNQNEVLHEVTITKDFKLGKYPVTQEQWLILMKNNPSRFKGMNLPVENVSWNDCQSFIKKINKLLMQCEDYEEEGSISFRLPTEAEWEFAARGGVESKGYIYSGSNNINEVGWFIDNSGRKTHPVGLKKPNELGLHDMSGNVWEWCQDWIVAYTQEKEVDPLGYEYLKKERIIRGGGWANRDTYCRCASRGSYAPVYGFNHYGFRLCLEI